MAKTASELNRKVLQNIRTTKTNTQIEDVLENTLALGEIAIQLGSGNTETESKTATGIWTLAADGVTAVRFPSVEWVKNEIISGTSISVGNVIEAVGLQSDGTLPTDWGTGSTYYTASDKVIDAVESLDKNLAELSGNVITLSGDVKNYVDTVSGNIETTILALDKDGNAVDGQVVTTVSQADGLVSETKANVKDLQLGGYSKDASATGAIASADTINTALSKLENQIGANSVSNADGSIVVTATGETTDVAVNIKSGEHVLAKDGNAGLYTDIKLSGVTPSSTNVKEEYVLKATDGTVLGEHIKIYKDSSLYRAYLGHVDDTITSANDPTVVPGTSDTALCFIYEKADGTYELVAVDVSKFLEETEFKSGVTATDHIVHGVVDGNSEKDSNGDYFLTVGAGGFKVDGIKDEIDAKINALDAGVSGKSSDNRVEVRIAEADGKLTSAEVLLQDVASASALTELSGSVIEFSGVVESIVEGFEATVSGETTHIDVTVVEENGKLTSLKITLQARMT